MISQNTLLDGKLLIAIVGVVFFLYSCNCKPNYPTMLVLADSAYKDGHYEQGNSLLNLYEQQNTTEDINVQMYHELLRIEKACLNGELTEKDYSIADSLCRFYIDHDRCDKYAKSMFFLGCVFQIIEDYPAALNCFLKAEELSKETNNTWLQCLVNRQQGDILFTQRMLDESIPFYQNYYKLATANHDTLRMALAASRMGRVYTIYDDVDSAIKFYKEAIHLTENLPQKEDLLPIAKSRLCDIYIQIEEFDSALTIMPHDELNDENWAYWHYGQHHTDSAIYYFRQMLGKYSWQAEVENLRILAQLELQRNNKDGALSYYKALEKAEDSLKKNSQIEETLKTNAQYNYNSIKRERDKVEEYGKKATITIFFLITIFLLLIVMVVFVWRSFRQKKNAEIEREKRLRLEEEVRHRQSLQKLVQNELRIAELKNQLEEAQRQGNTEKVLELKADADLLSSENINIKAIWQKRKLLLDNARQQPIYKKVIQNVGNKATLLNDDDWLHLSNIIDAVYCNFTIRLLDLAKLKDIELRVCYLLKMEVQPTDIGPMVGRVKSTISMMCSRIYKKLTQQEGSSKELSQFLQKL